MRSSTRIGRLKAYTFWRADYRATRADYNCGIWQYIGDAGRCPGVIGACDNNYAYKDYAQVIRTGGWNGFDVAAGGPGGAQEGPGVYGAPASTTP